MSKVCKISNKRPMSGFNVSHANNKTKRRFLPNITKSSFYSETLDRFINLKISTSAIRTINYYGGIDHFVKKTKKSRLPSNLQSLKKLLIAKEAEQQATN